MRPAQLAGHTEDLRARAHLLDLELAQLRVALGLVDHVGYAAPDALGHPIAEFGRPFVYFCHPGVELWQMLGDQRPHLRRPALRATRMPTLGRLARAVWLTIGVTPGRTCIAPAEQTPGVFSHRPDQLPRGGALVERRDRFIDAPAEAHEARAHPVTIDLGTIRGLR
ncbi:MAG: hypothetical protein DHS20C14_06740 [Phycisphaeraceae bacterium]|nr:MAG: hypothetical protein DHS20C14_06740 [Phycisphaeraceae bacterium]